MAFYMAVYWACKFNDKDIAFSSWSKRVVNLAHQLIDTRAGRCRGRGGGWLFMISSWLFIILNDAQRTG